MATKAALTPVKALGVNAWPFSIFTSAKNFGRNSPKSVGLTVLRSTVIFLSHTISRTFLPHTQLLSWCFSLEVLAQFHPVSCSFLSPTRKKLKIWDFFHFKVKSLNVKRSLQNYKVSKCRASTNSSTTILANSGIEMVSSGSHWSSEVTWHLCRQSESGRHINFQPTYFPFDPQKGAFYRGQFTNSLKNVNWNW